MSVKALEQQLKNAKALVEMRGLILKLNQNREFKKVILEEFAIQEAARYVGLSADPSLAPTERADALAMAQATGHLRRWLSVNIQMGDVAARDLEALPDMIAAARAEEDSDE